MIKIPDTVRRELEGLTVPYEIREGSRHHKLIVNGKFCAILPKGGGNSNSRRADLNIRSQIRRAAAQGGGQGMRYEGNGRCHG